MPRSGQNDPQRVGVRELRGNLTAYLRLARQGTPFLITAHDQVVAELRPPAASLREPRQPGALRGQIRLAEDFDALPDDVLRSLEGEG